MWNAISPGVELVSPCPIPATINIIPRAPRALWYASTEYNNELGSISRCSRICTWCDNISTMKKRCTEQQSTTITILPTTMCIPTMVWTASITWCTRRKLACTKILQNFWLIFVLNNISPFDDRRFPVFLLWNIFYWRRKLPANIKTFQ